MLRHSIPLNKANSYDICKIYNINLTVAPMPEQSYMVMGADPS